MIVGAPGVGFFCGVNVLRLDAGLSRVRARQTPRTPVPTWERPFVIDRNIRHFLWYGGVAGDGLRSVGADGELPIQERVLYPAHRSTFSGRGFRAPASIMPRAALVLPIVPGAAYALRTPSVARDLGWC